MDEVAADDKTNNKDLRSWNLGADLKYENLEKSLIKIKYTYSLLYLRPEVDGKLSKSSTTHTITPQYIYSLRAGTITYELPISVTSESTGDNTGETGFGISYTPYWHNQWFAPPIV